MPTESDLQAAIIRWASTLEPNYPELKWLHHIPNGGKRDSRTAMMLQAQGVKKGILDLHLPVARGPYHGLMIELKIPDGKQPKPSQEQKEYTVFLTDQGYLALCMNDFVAVKQAILDYLGLPK
jgi:hypothetical protein